MNALVFLLNNTAVSIFGSVLSAAFCKALDERHSRRVFWCGAALLLLAQALVNSMWDAAFLRLVYPLVVHLPLWLLLCALTRKALWSGISVLSAYLCCQLRRWIALLAAALLSGGPVMRALVELIVTAPLLLLLLRFVAPSISRLIDHPVKIQLQFGAIPALYYVFDYTTIVYTDLLTSGAPVVVEFMPFVCCCAYIAFLLYSSAEERRYIQLLQAQKTLDLQLRQSVREIAALRESQTLTSRYRHDLRHHLQYLSSCIESGRTDQASAYISGICQEIEAQKVERYCENESANLILSSFAGRARAVGVGMTVQGTLPSFILLPDSDLCVLLSNALENALNACQSPALAGQAREIDVQAYDREGKLFLQVTNPCGDAVRFENGVPVTDRPSHGIGVQSICAIARKYGGVCSFLVKDGRFILRLSI